MQIPSIQISFANQGSIEWPISRDRGWLIAGGTESQRSEILNSIHEQLVADISIADIGPDAQDFLIEREAERDDSDITDIVFEGTPLRELLEEVAVDSSQISLLVEKLGLSHRLDTGFRKLSSGETRKTLILRALLAVPDIITATDPLEGLDVESRRICHDLLGEYGKAGCLIVAMDRIDELPEGITHCAYLSEDGLTLHSLKESSEFIDQLKSVSHLKDAEISLPDIPDKLNHLNPPALDPNIPLVEMRNIRMHFGDNVLVDGLGWTVNAGEHWQIKGVNGSGKTSLLKLITGDNPQCYTNDIRVFSYQRGSGESIWDIKRYIGLVSSDLQWAYRVSGTALDVVISGLYDSIGLYRQTDNLERDLALHWLSVIGIKHLAGKVFRQLSFGDQRLVLIARAMIKQPKLLILDEPCQNLDAINRQRVIALVEKLIGQADVTVLYVTHYAEERIQQIQHVLDLDEQKLS